MQYREYGKTGKKVSALAFGAMRLPDDEEKAVELLTYGLDKGINYIDTAMMYVATAESTSARPSRAAGTRSSSLQRTR